MSLWSWLYLFVASVVVPWVSRGSPRRAEAANLSRAHIYASVSLSLWVLAVVAYLVVRIDGGGLADLYVILPADGSPVGVMVAWSLVLTGAGLAIFAAGHALRARLGLAAEEGILRRMMPVSPGEKLWVLLVVAPSAGICEELIYRGFVVSRLSLIISPVGAAGLAALVFGLAHAYQGRLGAIRAGLIALLLSTPILRAGTVLPAMAAHALIDAVGILWLWPLLERRRALTGAPPESY